ncbi:MAG: efflux RND transporter permease subunit, partial [Elusimicrobiota bacterium]|nr:efflux RND transporter permease subunit [Elusimicrobiota bacterium]
MSIASFSIRQKVLINLLTAVALLVGGYKAFHMQREVMPAVEIDYVFVKTPYPGASPQEVEKLVTMPLEDALNNIDGIDLYNSVSREGFSLIFIELESDLSNRDRVITNIAREMDKVELPDDAEDVETEEMILEHPLIEVSFTGDGVPEEELREYVKGFENIIKDIEGIGSISKVGWRDKEVAIEIDPRNLEDYYISLVQVIQRIRAQNLNLPGGTITSGGKELILRTVGEIDDPRGFGEIIIRTNSDGKYVKLSDIASIKETFEEQEVIYKTDGKVSINITPKKKTSGDTISLVDEIKKAAVEYKRTLPDAVSIDYINDMAFYVKRRLNVLVSNGVMGLLLLLGTLLVFLNVRIALITAIGIPFAFFSALWLMSFFGVSMNMITMFGLILVLGMIVDDAIVVSENVFRHIEDGMPSREAALKGAQEVAAPVTTTILTTAAAFLPLMFISGIMGKFLRVFPMSVIACLVASLFEALLILPSHLAEWIRPLKSRPEKAAVPAGAEKERGSLTKLIAWPFSFLKTLGHYFFSHDRKGSDAGWFIKLLNRYKRLLKYALNRRYRMIGGAVAVLVFAVIFAVKFLPFKMFPSMVEIFYVRVEAEEGAVLEETNRLISAVEESVLTLSKDELLNVTTTVGYLGDTGGGPFDKYGTKYAQCVVYLTPESSRDRKAAVIVEELRKKVTAKNIKGIANLEFETVRDGPPVGKPVAIEVRGPEFETLEKISAEVKSFMLTVEGIEDIKDDYELDKEEIQINIDKKNASRLGLTVRQIAMTIRYAYEGGLATTMRKGDEDIDVVVRFPEKDRCNFDTLRELTIPNNTGRLIKLDKVASFEKYQGVGIFSHKDGERTITITANLNE